MPQPTDRRLLSTREAAALLGVKPESLYAYVSRGLLRRHRLDGASGSWFDPADVDRLAARGRGQPGAAARSRRELRIESGITTIEPDGHRYRGHPALALAPDAGFERVAELLWTGDLPARAPRWTADPEQLAPRRAPSSARCRVAPSPSTACGPSPPRWPAPIPSATTCGPRRWRWQPAGCW